MAAASEVCNATRCLGDGSHLIFRQRVRGSVRAVRAVQNTRVFQTETGVIAEVTLGEEDPVRGVPAKNQEDMSVVHIYIVDARSLL